MGGAKPVNADRGSSSIRSRLQQLTAALMIPAVAGGTYLVMQGYRQERSRAEQQLADTARALSIAQDQQLGQASVLLQALATSPLLATGDYSGFERQAREALARDGVWLVLSDEQGQQLINTSAVPGTILPREPLARPTTATFDGGRSLQLWNVMPGVLNQAPVVAMSLPVQGRDHTLRLAVKMTAQSQARLFDGLNLQDGWIATILDADGHIVARNRNHERFVTRSASPDLLAALRSKPEAVIESRTLEGDPSIAAYRRSDITRWTVLVAVPAEQFAQGLRRSAMAAILAGALLLGIGLILAAGVARSIQRPIERLAEAARGMGRNRALSVLPSGSGLSEVDAVAQALAGADARLTRDALAQTLLLDLHDATRDLEDPQAVQQEFAARVARHFGVSRCGFGEVEDNGTELIISRDYCDADLASAAGRYHLHNFGPALIDDLAQGKAVAVTDVQADERCASEITRATYAALHTRAALCVPLVKAGRFVALLALHHREPRNWSMEEATLLEQIAQRTWFALESARAQAALQRSRDVLSLAMRGGRMGAWSRDLFSGKVWWSREMEDIFGLPAGGFQGREEDFIAHLHPDDHERVAQAMGGAIERRGDYVVEFRFLPAGGDWRWMEVRGRVDCDENGQPNMLYGLGIDITERQQSESELRRLNEELHAAGRRKDEFLATLAHELRNPLSPIRSGIEILRSPRATPTQAEWARDLILRQTEQMTRLVDDLLEASRITRGTVELRREVTDLLAAVRLALDAAAPQIEQARHRLELSMGAGPLWVNADPTRLVQVLVNLLNNAARYTPPGGVIALEVSGEGAQARIVVRDNGIGIEPQHLGSIFEMFSQVSPSLERGSGGLGIGLALARALVQMHGGSIAVESEGLGRGTGFIVTLPLLPQDSLPAAAMLPAMPEQSDGRRVLLADDNRDAAAAMAALLEMQGYDVRMAHDGEEALELATRFRPEAILLDIGMPRLNGYEVAQRLRGEPWAAQRLLVAISGWGQASDKARSREAGFDHHLTKPVNPTDLLRLLKDRLG